MKYSVKNGGNTMNEKLNTVFDIINATNTVSANRYLSHALGAEVAIIYNAHRKYNSATHSMQKRYFQLCEQLAD